MEDVVGECFPLSALTLKVILEFPDNAGHGLFSSSSEGGLVLLQEGVQVHLFEQF